MLVIKYTKEGTSKYISHLDMLKHIQRTLRRAKIQMNFSKGYNPHELLFFAPAAPTGVASKVEYVTVGSDMTADGLAEKFNEVSIGGVVAEYILNKEANPNIAAKATYAEYEMPYDKALFDALDKAFEENEFEITYEQKGNMVTKDVRDMMASFEASDDKIKVIIAIGNKTLRPDRLLLGVGFDIISEVVKTKLFIGDKDNLIDVDDFLRGE